MIIFCCSYLAEQTDWTDFLNKKAHSCEFVCRLILCIEKSTPNLKV